ncbi:MAG: hypothetical protein ABW151_11250 [Pseudorhodoplanes sp.]
MTSRTISNERIKLFANFANTTAAAFLSAGVIGPVLAFFYGIMPLGTGLFVVLSGAAICISFSAGIHLAGRAILGGIRE